MTLEEAVNQAQSDIETAKNLARDCYSIESVEVSALERAAQKVKDNQSKHKYLNTLLSISNIIKTQSDEHTAYNDIKNLIDNMEN